VTVVALHVFDVLAYTHVNFIFFRILRVFRVLRIGRLLRATSAARNLSLVLSCLSSIGRPLLWTFTTLIVCIYLFSLILLQIVEVHVRDLNMDFEPFEDHFGGVFETMWTMFVAACGAMPFNDFWGPFDSITKWYRLFLLVFVAIFRFGLLNVITAIVIDGVICISTTERDLHIRETMARDRSPLQKLKQVLLSSKKARDGFLSIKSLRRELIQNAEVVSLLTPLRLHADQVEGLAALLDRDNNDWISIEELVLAIMQLHGSPNHLATMLYDTKQSVARLNCLNQLVQERLDKVLICLSLGRSVSAHSEEII